jgi:GT2 family glycosyltransferase
VSVVVVSHNEGDNLRRTVCSLLAGLPADGEILVVDDGSTDGSAEALTGGYGGVSVLRPAERLGAPAARNFGGARARGEVIVFSDAHMEVPLYWFAPLRDALARPVVGAASPVVSVMQQRDSKGYGFHWRDAAFTVEWLGRQGADPYPVPMLSGCFVALRRELFAAIGGFDPGLVLWGMEDAELCLRLWTLGYECLVVPALDVAHLFRSAHGYPVDWEVVLHNMLRVAVVHFGADRLGRVVCCLCTHTAFPAAFARLAESDAWARRAAVRAARRHDDQWFFHHFGMTC